MANDNEIELVSDDPRPPPQGPSEGTSTIPLPTQPPLHATGNYILPPGYVPNYSLYAAPGTSNVRPPIASVRNISLVVSGAWVSAPYNHTPQYESPVENEKSAKTVEFDEMTRKMKSFEQNIKNIQGLGGHKSVSLSDLCIFPHIYLPPGFKTPKFEKYDGHDDPIAHLKRYCNQLRGIGGKEELLMDYFGKSLMGVAYEWLIDQDISHWHVWDGMAQAFIKQF
ncbi:uncharacterized protein [Nicotiana tomentosiformis]|uniref:uncharacterized protein n=1 Tax=Nicotiana tomentosiformis TaxID=4098 RepID=UPI00388C8994